MQPSLTTLGRSTARGCPSCPWGTAWILTRALHSSTQWDLNSPWQVRPGLCWPKGSSGIAGKGGGWACWSVVFKTKMLSCTLLQGMASSAITTTLLLSSSSFAIRRLCCVRQKTLSADPHETYCSSTFSGDGRLCVHTEDALGRFTWCTFCLTSDSFCKGKPRNPLEMLYCFPFSSFSIFPFFLCHHLLSVQKLSWSSLHLNGFCSFFFFFLLSLVVLSRGFLP